MAFRHHIPYGSFGAPGGGQQEAPEQTHLTHLMTPKGRRIHVYMSKWKFIEAPSRTFSYRYGFIITYYFQGQPAPQSHTEQTCSSACRLQLRNTGSAGVSLRSLPCGWLCTFDCELQLRHTQVALALHWSLHLVCFCLSVLLARFSWETQVVLGFHFRSLPCSNASLLAGINGKTWVVSA